LVDNLLDLSRLQAGVLSVHLAEVPLDAVLGSALLRLGQRSTQIATEVPDGLPMVRADAGLLERVLVNVLSNALTASPADKPVEVTAEITGEQVSLIISDSGTGVAAEYRDRIVEPFQRLHDRSTTGLGLGLAIDRGFMEAMGGEIRPTDTPGGGLIDQLPSGAYSNPRRKLEPDPSRPRYLITEPSIGYRFLQGPGRAWITVLLLRTSLSLRVLANRISPALGEDAQVPRAGRSDRRIMRRFVHVHPVGVGTGGRRLGGVKANVGWRARLGS
jgi:Histidine kinase-, DNA gyrase B-, and HSP90-like ATPase